jgi:hypothetical protein
LRFSTIHSIHVAKLRRFGELFLVLIFHRAALRE